jgi:hypothetical protein
MNESIHQTMRSTLLMGTQELQVQEAPSVRVFDDIQDLVQELVSIFTPLASARNKSPKQLEDGSLLIESPVRHKISCGIMLTSHRLLSRPSSSSNEQYLKEVSRSSEQLLNRKMHFR